MAAHVSFEKIDQMIDLYDHGIATKKIYELLKVSPSTIETYTSAIKKIRQAIENSNGSKEIYFDFGTLYAGQKPKIADYVKSRLGVDLHYEDWLNKQDTEKQSATYVEQNDNDCSERLVNGMIEIYKVLVKMQHSLTALCNALDVKQKEQDPYLKSLMDTFGKSPEVVVENYV